MTGTDEVTCALKSIEFPGVFVHADFAAYNPGVNLKEEDIAWKIMQGLNVSHVDEHTDAISISVCLSLNKKQNALKIAELFIKTTYHVDVPLSFESKYFILCRLMNQAAGHIQGAWSVKIKNVLLHSLLPQVFDKIQEDELALKKLLYESWE